MRLAEIISDCEIDVKELRYDSRAVEPGDMFFAIVGFKTDGHNYIASAIENGAKCIVVEEGKIDISLIRDDVTVLVTSNSRKFMAPLTIGLADRVPSGTMRI